MDVRPSFATGMYLIGVRYCGGCNPQIDRGRAVKGVQELLKNLGVAADFTTARERSVDLLLLVNGCIHACLEEDYRKQGETIPFISVKGEMVDNYLVREDRIPEIVSKKITLLLDPSAH